MAANQVDFKILPSDQFSVYSPATRSDKVITYFTLLSKLRGDILSVGQDDDPNDIVSAFYSSVGGTQTLHLVKADGSEVTASNSFAGTVTSVDMSVPTGFSISGNPITTSGTLVVGFASGYSLPTDAIQATWTTAYNRSLTSAAVTGTSTKTLTLTQQDTNLITATWTDLGLTSVGLTMPAAFSVANSPLTANGTLAVTAAGLSSQYIRGDGQLANFPTPSGGGSSVNYYLNGSVNQGVFGGDTYYELSKTPISGAGTNFTRTSASGDGYVASFITDANDPDQINIPGGNFNLEFYFNSSSSGGSPAFYGELYKVSTLNVFTLIASGSANSEVISGGTAVDQYYTSIAVPQTALLATDRLAIRVYVIVSGRNITLHTENSNFSEVITTFSTGLNSLNGLSDQVQYFAVGTSGTDFAISSSVDTHTFNLPTASAANRGALSSADWTTFNGKASDAFKTIAVTGQSDIVADNATDTLTLVAGTNVTITTNATTDTITINSADQFVGTVTSVNLTASTGISVSGGPITTSGSITVTNTAPDQTVVLTGAGTTSISGTYPSFTITSNDQFVGTVTSVAALTLGTTGTDLSSTVANGTTTPVITLQVPTASATNRGALSSTDWTTFNSKQGAITLTTTGTTGAATFISNTLNIPNYADQFVGTVTSVNMSVPTGFAISGNPITTSGTLAVAFAVGYSLPTNASQTTWNTAYNDSITAFAYNTSTGVLTLTQQDAGTLTATVTLQPFSTTNLAEGTNLYYTDTRARLALSAGTGISYDSATGVITNSAPDLTVVLTGGTGISTSGTYPSFTITNTAPDQVVALTGAGTTTISGTYPSFTITSSDQYVGTVTSVDLTASTGISVSGGPITSSGSITVTNTAPDQVVVVTAGTGISTSGTYPSFTVTNSAPDQTVVLTAGTGITTSGTYPNFTVTNSAPDQTVVLTAGTGISVSGTYPNFTVTNSSPSSGGTVTSVAALTIGTTGTDLSSTVANGTTTPVITLQVPTASAANRGALSSTDWTTFNNKQGTITLTTTGSTGAATFISNTLNIPNYTDQFVGTVTSVDLTAGTGITVSGGPITTSGSITVNNSDRGSSQNIFKNINVITSQDWDDSDFVWNVDAGSWSGGIDQEAIVADNNNDTLFIESVGGISITTDSTTDTIYFDNIDKGSEQNIFKNFAVSGQSTIVADLNDDTLTVASGTGISLTTNASTDTLTITNSAPDQTVVLTAGTGISTSGTYPNFTITNSSPDQTVSLTGAGTTSISGSYPNFTITSNDQYVGTVTSVGLTAGTGITISGGPITSSGSITVTNDDRGSSQNIFKNIAVTGQSTIVADLNDDTLTVAAGTGISITTNATTDTLTITNTAASLDPKTESINIRATVPYTVVTPFDDVVIDTVDVKRNAPNTVTSTSKLLAIVTLQVDNTGSIGFTGFTLRLFNTATSAAITNTATKWSAYMYPAATEFGFTSFTYHIPIDDTSVAVSNPIQLQLQLEVGTCDITIANFTLMSISK